MKERRRRKGKMQEGRKKWKNEGRKEKQIVDIECGPAQLSLFFNFRNGNSGLDSGLLCLPVEQKLPSPGHLKSIEAGAEQRIAPGILRTRTSLGWRQCNAGAYS